MEMKGRKKEGRMKRREDLDRHKTKKKTEEEKRA
jgi:hypothetical protein